MSPARLIMPDRLEISFCHKNHFILYSLPDSDSMLQVFPESLHFMYRSALVGGIDCAQPNSNPSWNPVNGNKC